MPDLSGRTLGKYQLIERLGRGGMADVYRGYHPRLERYVAVKTLHSHLVEASPDFLPRFEREAKAVATLRHPHIVQVYDFDLEGDIYYMVMELVDGGSLADVLLGLSQSRQRLPYTRILELLHELGGALDYAHQQHMLHRDIKPSNVLLDKAGHAYLADFGIARILGSGTHFTTTGTLIGTPHYMSPEQGQGQELTPASDIYAVGVMLYEMLVGRVPYEAETPYGIIHKHINEPLPAASQLRSDLPASVETVLNRALAKEAGERYQSAGELATAFQQALGLAMPTAPAPVSGETRPVPPAPPVELPQGAAAAPPPVAPVQPADQPVYPGQESPPPDAGPAAQAAVPPGKESTPVTPVAAVGNPPGVPGPLPPPAAVRPPAAAHPALEGPALAAAAPRKTRKRSGLTCVALLVALLFLGAAGYFGFAYLQRQVITQGCDTPEACLEQANQLVLQGDLTRALAVINLAIDLVPADAHPPYAGLLCRRGDINLMLERSGQAGRDFELCIDWTERDPSLEDLRAYARERLQTIR